MPPAIGVPFHQIWENMLVAEHWWEQGWNNDDVVKGGLSEPIPVRIPHLGAQGKVRLFYRGLHGAPWSVRPSFSSCSRPTRTVLWSVR